MRPNNVKLERVKADMSQQRLAELTGIAQDRLSRIETGRVRSYTWEALAIGKALGVTVECLFDKEKAPY